ncbi:MAG: hypothetical protein OEZ02_09250 [Anaerolineae bacterium]|nr:hypothetical protein [Anaerolineae bacterium]
MKKISILTLLGAMLLAGCVITITLSIVQVNAPAVNCIFDVDCTITVSDKTDALLLNGMGGSGFLQSRTWPVGEAGTPAEGLYGYEYRIDLREQIGYTQIACVTSMTIDFGPVSKLDYDEDGSTEDVYVITSGGLGNVAPSSAKKAGNSITFNFAPGVCAGGSPGNGDSSYFFGLASQYPPAPATATVKDNNGNSYTLDITAPAFGP